jgi:hypothetical protein
VYVHSKEVTIQFNKQVHLDHFHYRISPLYISNNIHGGREKQQNGVIFYLRTYENDRLILDYTLNSDQARW